MSIIIKAKVDDLVKWQTLQEQCKKEIDRLKSEFQNIGIAEMKDKKINHVKFYGSNNSRVTVTCTETVNVISHKYLESTLGEVLKDFAKEDTTYKYENSLKQILKSIKNGTYIEQTIEDVVNQITTDEKIRATLKRKIKGNYEKDVETIKSLTGLNQKDAEHYAYFCSEAYNYEKIVNLIRVAGYDPHSEGFLYALNALKHSVEVGETIKVSIDSEVVA